MATRASLGSDIDELRRAAAGCRACALWKRATQTVFGVGPPSARLMLVGEQPGDQEDRQGRPFVGPAGRMLDRALEGAGIDRGDVWVTNAVKHFKWKPGGKRRLHDKPSAGEVNACLPWLEYEILATDPDLVVCLGATAARALLGPAFRLTLGRGKVLRSPLAERVLATIHPSALLRAPDSATRQKELDRLVRDLRHARQCAGRIRRRRSTAA
jgi:DNA polymerase